MRELFTMWRSTRMVVLTAITAALYAATQIAFRLPILPGVTEVRPGVAFVLLCSFLFGPAAAWGAAVGNTIGDLAGGLGPGTVVGFAANFLLGLLPYRVMRLLAVEEPVPLRGGRLVAFVAATVAGAVGCGLAVGVGIQSMGLWPIAFLYLTNIVAIHNAAIGFLLGTFLVAAIYPRAAAIGLCWTEIMGEPAAVPSAPRRAAVALAFALMLAAYVLGNVSEQRPAPWAPISVVAGLPLALAVALLLLPEASLDAARAEEARAAPPPAQEVIPAAGGGTLAFAFEDVRFRYRGGAADALAGLRLSLEEGRFLAVVGPTGAGKTTLTRVLGGIIPGSLRGAFAGRLAHLDPRDTGLVFEDFEAQLFTTETTLEVAFGAESRGVPKDEIAARVTSSLARVGLAGFEGRSPAALSGGEKQRLAIAAALAQAPRVLVLDEPTTDLDPVGKRGVLDALRALRAEGRTIVLVEHETEELGAADRVALVSGGKVVREGPAREVLADSELLRAHGVRPPELPRLFGRMGLDPLKAPIDDDAEAARLLAEAGITVAGPSTPDALRVSYAQGERIGEVVIAAEGVRHTYEGRTVPAVDGVSLEVRAGEFVAILGANGSGKSSLARVLNGMVAPSQGTVRGADARNVGFVFQNPDHQIFCASVEEEVAFGPRNQGLPEEEIAARVAAALETVGLGGAQGKDPFALPKSDRQRLALAAVLAMRTPVILMDEPTTGLDHADQRRMMDLLVALNGRGHTIVVITHHIWIALEYARRIVLLARGKKVADGPVREVMRESDALAEARVTLPPLSRLGLRLGVAARTLDELAGVLRRRAEVAS